jgi:hypothetical protein
MKISTVGLILLARSLPRAVSDRYRLEWIADAEYSRDLGLKPHAILFGAARMAAGIDRSDPSVTGLSRFQMSGRRARWAGVLICTAIVSGIAGLFAGWSQESSAISPMDVVALISQVLCAIFLTSGAVMALGSLGALIPMNSLALTAAQIAVCAGVTGAFADLLGLGMSILCGIASASLLLLVAFTGSSDTTDRAGTRSRPFLILLPAFLLVAISVGVLHITVWSPLAKVPNKSLSEIYTEMESAGQAVGIGLILGWVIIWTVAALALPFMGRGMNLRRRGVIALWLLLLGGTLGTTYFAGGAMLMSIADTFGTTGEDVSASGNLLAVIAEVAAISGLLALAPADLQRPAGQYTDQQGRIDIQSYSWF